MQLELTPEDVSIIDWAINNSNSGSQLDAPQSVTLQLYIENAPAVSSVEIIKIVDSVFADSVLANPDSPAMFYGADLEIPPNSPALQELYYTTSADPYMFPIGTLTTNQDDGAAFSCDYPACDPSQNFGSVKELQYHFETTHFPYRRLHDCRRLVCPACSTFFADSGFQCSNPRCNYMMPLVEKVYGKVDVDASVNKNGFKRTPKRTLKMPDSLVPSLPKSLLKSYPRSEEPSLFLGSSKSDSVFSSRNERLENQSSPSAQRTEAQILRTKLEKNYRHHKPCSKQTPELNILTL
jgi:hypothetical protein